MSKDNNVNPGQYKVGGRLRQDDEARAAEESAKTSKDDQRLRNDTHRPEKKKD
jgi:hypothetical protein